MAKRKYYPSNSPGGDSGYDITGKSTAWFSFIPKDGHTIGNKISKLAFRYSVGVTNFTPGQNKDFNDRKVEVDLTK